MHTHSLVLVAGSALLVSICACGDDADDNLMSMDADSGAIDSGMLVDASTDAATDAGTEQRDAASVDAVMPPDSDAGADAETDAETHDAGELLDAMFSDECSLVGVSRLAPLPASCLPRCELATAAAISSCAGDGNCIREARAADPTPSANATTDTGQIEIDCETCLDRQLRSCVAQWCPDEVDADLDCEAATPGDCDATDFALRQCVQANQPDGGDSCIGMRSGLCFDPS